MPGAVPEYQIIGRAADRRLRSATLAASYRARMLIRDDLTGEAHDYSKRHSDVLHSEIMTPEGAPAWAKDRVLLWNEVERFDGKGGGAGNRKWRIAQLAREVMIPLPCEVDHEARKALLRQFVREAFVSQGMIADINIHKPGKEGDQRNEHAHVILTMRRIGPEGFIKGDRPKEWDNPANVEKWHRHWERVQNAEFARRGLEVRADYRAFEVRGIDREPEQHLGPAATAMERKGKKTRIGAANENRRGRNAERADLHREALEIRRKVARERERFDTWKAEKAAELGAEQQLSRLDLVRRQELQTEKFRDDLAQTYDPHLRTVEYEAGRLSQRVQTRGFRGLWQRVTGSRARDEERLAQMQETIRRTAELKAYETAKHAERQREEMAVMEQRQEWRREQQQEAFARTEAKKAETLRHELLRAAGLEAQQATRDAEAAQAAAFREASQERQTGTGPPQRGEDPRGAEPEADPNPGRERSM